MTIRPGVDWGEPCEVDPTWPVVSTDAAVVAAAPGPVVLSGGDLLRALGGRGGPVAVRYPIDLLRVRSDAGEHCAVAHVVARGTAWSGPCLVAMGGSHLGERYLGPRAHPNDGLVDVTEGELPLRQRLVARTRARTGSHLPHPALRTRRVASLEVVFDRPRRLLIDGRRVGRTRRLGIEVEPDAVVVVVAAAT